MRKYDQLLYIILLITPSFLFSMDEIGLYVKHGVTVLFRDENYRVNELCDAIKNGDNELATFFIDHCNLNALNAHGSTPLDMAVCKGHKEIAIRLLEKRADPNSVDKRGWSPIMTAAFYNHLSIVKILFDCNADLNVMSNNGHGVLWVAAQEGHEEIVTFFLEKNVNPDSVDRDNCTPLSIAVDHNHLQVTEVLLDHKADPNFKDCEGCTPLGVAVERGSDKIIDLLLVKNESMGVLNAEQAKYFEEQRDISLKLSGDKLVTTKQKYLVCSETFKNMLEDCSDEKFVEVDIMQDQWRFLEKLLPHAFAFKNNRRGALEEFKSYVESQSDKDFSLINYLVDYFNIVSLEKPVFDAMKDRWFGNIKDLVLCEDLEDNDFYVNPSQARMLLQLMIRKTIADRARS